MSVPTAVPGRAALLELAGDDPLVSCFASEDSVGYVESDAVVWYRSFKDRRMIMGSGDPAGVADLFTRVLPAANAERFTLPQPVFENMPVERRPQPGGRWHWFQTRTAPPVHVCEDRCEWLTPRDHPRVNELLDVAFPTASSRPDRRQDGVGWFGARDDDGVIVACGNANTTAGIGPMLGSIAVHPDARRRGLASALTSWVTRRLLDEGHPMVALGSYAGEEATHRLYRRLGFRDLHVLVSGRLAGPARFTADSPGR